MHYKEYQFMSDTRIHFQADCVKEGSVKFTTISGSCISGDGAAAFADGKPSWEKVRMALVKFSQTVKND